MSSETLIHPVEATPPLSRFVNEDPPAPLSGPPPAAHGPHILLIEAGKGERQYWRDLWTYRELIYFLAWRDILVRYKQTAIGIAWSVLRPLITMLLGTFIFEKVLHLQSMHGVPYPILIYSAILPWQFFTDALTGASLSLVNNSAMISRIYFPRLIMPVSKLFVSLVDFAISLLVLALLMAYYRFLPSSQMVYLPAFLLLACLAATGAGQWFAALNVKYRDFMYVVPVIVQFGIYISSVFFTSDRIYANDHIPTYAKTLYSLNPMVGVIDGFRWCILGPQATVNWIGVVGSIAVTALLLVTGLGYFRHTERTFADVI